MSLTANIRTVQSSAYYEHHGGDCSLRGVTEAMAFAAAPFPSCCRRGAARFAQFAWRACACRSARRSLPNARLTVAVGDDIDRARRRGGDQNAAPFGHRD